MDDNKIHWCTSSGRIELEIELEDAHFTNHSGDCEQEVKQIMRFPYIKEQLSKIDAALLWQELREWGAWSEQELGDHKQNLMRIVWLAAGAISDEAITGEG